MGKFINGYKYPIFKILNTTSKITEVLEFPWTDVDGLVETLTEESVRHELYNGTISNITRGFKVKFSLSYNRYITKDTIKKIRSILEAQKAGYKIFLTPRADLPRRNFEVVFTGESIDIGILRGGATAIGNKLVVLEFTTKYMQDDTTWIDPDEIQYTGFKAHNPLNVIEV